MVSCSSLELMSRSRRLRTTWFEEDALLHRDGSPFLRNHAEGIAAADLFVVSIIGLRLLFGLVILSHDRRQIIHVAATYHPTAEWIAR